MYEIKVINNGEETIINAVSSDNESPRLLNCNIKHGINTIDSLSFNITPNNLGYSKIKAITTLIEALNTKTNEIEFKGRILLPVDDMDSDGSLIMSVTCESELGYLRDSSTVYGEYHNITVRDFLQVIIDNHNNQVSEDKRFVLGNVTVQDNNDSLYRFLEYEKTFDVIKDKLIDKLGGELKIRYENGIRYLDYLTSIGEVKATEIRLAKNLKTIEQEKDPTSIITRLIPLGYKFEDTEERLTIESVNNGIKYIDDQVAISQFGIIVEPVVWDDVTNPVNLLSKGQSYLIENNKIKKKYKLSALDLSVLNLDVDSFNVGNTYRVINPIMGIDEDLRVIEKTIDINSPYASSLTIGDKFEDIKEGYIKISKKASEAIYKADTNASNINRVKVELKQTAEGLETMVTNVEEGLQSQININAENITSKVTAGQVSSIIQQDAESVKVGFNGISNNVTMSPNGLGINGGGVTVTNENGVVVIDGSSNMFKIHTVFEVQLIAGDDLQYVYRLRHGLGYVPAYQAFQVGTTSVAGESTNTLLPAMNISSTNSEMLGFSAILRANADDQDIIITYTRANTTIYNGPRIKVFVFKEALI